MPLSTKGKKMKIDGRRIFEIASSEASNIIEVMYQQDVVDELTKLSGKKLRELPDGEVSEGFNEKYAWVIMKKGWELTLYYKPRKDIKETDRAEWLRDEIIKSGKRETTDYEYDIDYTFYEIVKNSETSIELCNLGDYINQRKRGKDKRKE